ILRTVAEAAGAGAREGRARLLLELLSLEGTATAPATRASGVEASGVEVARRPAAELAARPAQAPTRPARPTVASEPAPEPVAAAVEPTAVPIAAPAATGGDDVGELRRRWAEVVERATPVIKPLLRECRPVARDGARLTLAFPEGRDFMRSRIAQRSAAIESLLSEMFGGSFAIECVASNLELEPLSVEQAIGAEPDDHEARALLEGVLKITGGELVDAPEVR
ncbi:MAG TPA: hypothetical protein VHF58_06425, partial [Solirubrobacterales bacterium]|nr:hypothetical protein [Solirubrobacterales bacterium]